LTHPTCIRRPRRGGVTPVEFRGIFGVRKLESLGYRAVFLCVILRLAFLVERRLVTDTDRQTQTRTRASG